MDNGHLEIIREALELGGLQESRIEPPYLSPGVETDTVVINHRPGEVNLVFSALGSILAKPEGDEERRELEITPVDHTPLRTTFRNAGTGRSPVVEPVTE